ncbi:hypothetical protein QYE76_008634 [Lolium multiflorum]|uniref:Uncharacterized protein n=1 Tax=Lolium multiflorum TaxID=4521 RepID=A0AAD8X2E3_LOLMU|nr:hypothetical protein QYE76_008634 [Lolium multiflorum]
MAAEDLEWERSKISNQDVNTLKRLGLMKKEDAIRFPSEESYPNPPMEYRVSFVDHLIRGLSAPIHDFLRGLLFVYGIQLHQLTPNSILHISIFITLCECFLGIPPNRALETHFRLRNGSHNATYNIGGVIVSEPRLLRRQISDSVQGWRKGLECSLFSRKNPLWTYSGENNANRISSDLSAKDLEKLIRRVSRLAKKDPIPSSCRVEPYSSANPLPRTILLWLPFRLFLRMEKSKNRLSLPKTPKVLLFLKVKSQVLTNLRLPMKKKLNLKPASRRNPFLLLFPKEQKERNDAEDSGTSKAEKVVPSHPKAAYDPYIESLVSSDDEEEVPTVDVAPRTSTSHTVLASDTLVEGEESSPPQQNVVTTTPPASPLAPSPKRTRIETVVDPAPQLGSSSTLLLDDPMIKELLRIGSQFIGYREYASRAEEKLAEANKRADALAQKLEQSEAARKKAELVASEAKAEADEAKAKATSVEELQKRLEDAESALNEHKAAQASREQGILKRLKSQSRRTHTQTGQDFDLENPVNDPLLDALSYLELHGSEIREGVANANAGLSALFPYFFPKKKEPPTFLALAKIFNSPEDLGLKMHQENMKIAVESTVALVADSQQTVDWTKVGDTDQIEQSRWWSWVRFPQTAPIDKKNTPDFNGQYEKLKDDWPEFVRQKQSEHFKAISERNKANAAKKMYNHIMGPGGYRLSEPKWEKMENDLRARGIPLGTEGWDPRAKSWWYGHGGSLDPETGVCVHRKKAFKPTQALIDAMTQAQERKIRFNRENDALTLALGNREHPGRVRGKGAIPWKVGFSQDNDPYSYRSPLHHNNPIEYGYARVTVEDIVQGFEDLEIDYATPEGERRLGDIKRQFILWKKKDIVFPGEAPRLTSPPGGGGGGGGGGGSPTPPSRQPTPPQIHNLRVSSRRPILLRQYAPNPPPAKKRRADSKVTPSWTINPDPYVPKTTKVPEPSLKPLLPRPWELSEDENNLAAAGQYEKWKADMKAKKEPEPKPVFT